MRRIHVARTPGAIGLPQFMPSSYRKHAVDFDGDGRRDLVASRADAIGSVANYYRSYDWKTGETAIVAAESGDADLGPLLAAGIKPHISVRELREKGVVIPDGVDENALVTLFAVETERGGKLYLGLNNFYVITRYNRSINYAMAVWELAGGDQGTDGVGGHDSVSVRGAVFHCLRPRMLGREC